MSVLPYCVGSRHGPCHGTILVFRDACTPRRQIRRSRALEHADHAQRQHSRLMTPQCSGHTPLAKAFWAHRSAMRSCYYSRHAAHAAMLHMLHTLHTKHIIFTHTKHISSHTLNTPSSHNGSLAHTQQIPRTHTTDPSHTYYGSLARTQNGSLTFPQTAT